MSTVNSVVMGMKYFSPSLYIYNHVADPSYRYCINLSLNQKRNCFRSTLWFVRWHSSSPLYLWTLSTTLAGGRGSQLKLVSYVRQTSPSLCTSWVIFHCCDNAASPATSNSDLSYVILVLQRATAKSQFNESQENEFPWAQQRFSLSFSPIAGLAR